jgi:hypothetical protein
MGSILSLIAIRDHTISCMAGLSRRGNEVEVSSRFEMDDSFASGRRPQHPQKEGRAWRRRERRGDLERIRQWSRCRSSRCQRNLRSTGRWALTHFPNGLLLKDAVYYHGAVRRRINSHVFPKQPSQDAWHNPECTVSYKELSGTDKQPSRPYETTLATPLRSE